MKIESAERAQPEEQERSQEEIERINEAKVRLQAIIDKAATTADRAVDNKFIPELVGARLRKFLEKTAKEANDVDNSENGTDIIVAYIEDLCEKVKLPGDIRMEKDGKFILQQLEEMEQRVYQETTGDIDSQIQNRKQKRKGGFLRL